MFCVIGSALYVMSIFVVRGVNAANAWYESPTFFVAVEAGRRCGRIEDHEAFALDLLLQENSVFATVLQDVPQIVISAVIASKTEFTTVQVVALVVSCLGIAYRAVQCARSAAGRGANGWHTGFLVSMCLMPKELAAGADEAAQTRWLRENRDNDFRDFEEHGLLRGGRGELEALALWANLPPERQAVYERFAAKWT